MTVRSTADPARTEGTGSYTTGAMSTATRLPLSVRETPQSISVVTRQQIDDQGLVSIEDLANAVTGLSVSRASNERGSVYSRGFSMNYYAQDGLPMSSNADTLGFATLALYDRVEVLRGAAGMMNGAGTPSGTLNLVRKRANRASKVTASGSVGRWDDHRVEVDANGPLNADGSLRGRAVLAAQDSDTFIDAYGHERVLAYATVEADLGSRTTLSLGAHRNEEKNPGSSWYGLATQVDGTPYPNRSQTTAPAWAYWNKINSRIFVDLEHRFDGGWKARAAGHLLNDRLESLVNQLARSTTSPAQLMVTQANGFFYDREQRAFELSAAGPFELLGRRHEAVVGLSDRTLQTDDRGYEPDTPYTFGPFDPTTWDPSVPPTPTVSRFYYGQVAHTHQKAAYATARFNLLPSLALLAGARYDSFKYDGTNLITNRPLAKPYQLEELTPYAGLTYDLTPQWSAYASWTRVFNPQSTLDVNDKVLDPVTGTNLEAGVKGELYDGQLNLSAAVFRILQENLSQALPAEECNGRINCVVAAGEVQADGFELEAAGRLLPGWQVQGGYTYSSAEYTKDSGNNKAGTRFASDRPTRLLRLGTTYRLPGEFAAWRVGGAVKAQNAVQRLGSPVRQGGYATVDLLAGWQVTRQLDLMANVYNVFDRSYLATVGSTANSGTNHGEPRNLRLTARYTFE